MAVSLTSQARRDGEGKMNMIFDKGINMEINGQLLPTNRIEKQRDQMPDCNFEHLIHTPTKQNSGDEYYWQHQNQLQQSDLHFNAQSKANQNQKIKYPEIMPENNRNHPIEQLQTPNPSQWRMIPNQQLEHNPLELLTWESPEKNTVMQEQTLTQISLPNTNRNTSSQTSNSPLLNTINHIDEKLENMGTFKNHHLFIQNQEVELTLNVQSLDPQEQKELTQVIKDHLKKKGLSIKQLIINGVKND